MAGKPICSWCSRLTDRNGLARLFDVSRHATPPAIMPTVLQGSGPTTHFDARFRRRIALVQDDLSMWHKPARRVMRPLAAPEARRLSRALPQSHDDAFARQMASTWPIRSFGDRSRRNVCDRRHRLQAYSPPKLLPRRHERTAEQPTQLPLADRQVDICDLATWRCHKRSQTAPFVQTAC